MKAGCFKIFNLFFNIVWRVLALRLVLKSYKKYSDRNFLYLYFYELVGQIAEWSKLSLELLSGPAGQVFESCYFHFDRQF